MVLVECLFLFCRSCLALKRKDLLVQSSFFAIANMLRSAFLDNHYNQGLALVQNKS